MLPQAADEMLPLVFCGDFNFKPDSFPYACITSGTHALDHSSAHLEQHRKSFVAGWRAPEFAPMASLYAAVYGAEPAYTNNCITQFGNSGENPFCDTLDYVFASARVKARGAQLLPSEGPRLPNEHHPSDHLPVVVDVEID
jgi:endonuclease/exonuclease/phosphatase family metal-dependent hydrolase